MSFHHESVGVPALNLKAQYQTIRGEIEEAVRLTLESQYFVMGPEVSELEQEIADYCGASHGISCASGTDALLLPLMAWNIGADDEVITSPYTFFATASSIWRVGARPVFVDIDPETYNIDPSQIEAAITPKTKAIIPVHLYGQTADMDAIKEIADRHNLLILEDAAQAIGAKYKGRPAGTLGHACALSFYPSKNLGGFGDGGMITTDDPQLARHLARLRVHGMEPKYHHHEVGINSRLDALQAAILRVKLRHLDAWTTGRREAADRYRQLLGAAGLRGFVDLPIEAADSHHVYNQFVVRVPGTLRNEMRDYLTSKKIGTEIYYPIPLHLQECFKSLDHKRGDFPHAEAAARETIALPMFPELTDEQQRYIVGSIQVFADSHAHGALKTDRAA